ERCSPCQPAFGQGGCAEKADEALRRKVPGNHPSEPVPMTGFCFSGRIYFLIAMPSQSAKWLNWRTSMSTSNIGTAGNSVEVQCTLSTSDTYIETVCIKSIASQPWLNELTIKTQLLTAKDPEEKRIKAMSCMN
ncbi:MAG: hypothetical protein EBV49_13425, partial [Betaproteobacteria bacterium]|nr:hypothetical protein [Betaproteobacteria bacterium]